MHFSALEAGTFNLERLLATSTQLSLDLHCQRLPVSALWSLRNEGYLQAKSKSALWQALSRRCLEQKQFALASTCRTRDADYEAESADKDKSLELNLMNKVVPVQRELYGREELYAHMDGLNHGFVPSKRRPL